MTRKILCPTDGSDHARIGVILVAEVANATGGHLTICAVMDTGDKPGLQRLALGSVASEVATRAHCTVMIAR